MLELLGRRSIGLESVLLERIVSGGQTGVDRAALDVALECDIPCGGWCPKGRLAEDGPISDRYPLVETPKTDYSQRTKRNVRDSDGTLIVSIDELTGGTLLTKTIAQKQNKHFLVVNPQEPGNIDSIVRWLEENEIKILNVAGPRESGYPTITQKATKFLRELMERVQSREARVQS